MLISITSVLTGQHLLDFAQENAFSFTIVWLKFNKKVILFGQHQMVNYIYTKMTTSSFALKWINLSIINYIFSS